MRFRTYCTYTLNTHLDGTASYTPRRHGPAHAPRLQAWASRYVQKNTRLNRARARMMQSGATGHTGCGRLLLAEPGTALKQVRSENPHQSTVQHIHTPAAQLFVITKHRVLHITVCSHDWQRRRLVHTSVTTTQVCVVCRDVTRWRECFGSITILWDHCCVCNLSLT